MSFVDLNWIAILVAAIVLFAMGAIWYGPKTLFPIWWRLLGHPSNALEKPVYPMSKVFSFTAIGCLVQATFLSALIHSLNINSFASGLSTGLLVGLGIAAAPALSHTLFAQAAFNKNGLKIWAIETFPDAINMAVACAILAIW